MTGILGCLVSAVFQLALALAPLEALASDTSLESFAASSHSGLRPRDGLVVGGPEPVREVPGLAHRPAALAAAQDRPDTRDFLGSVCIAANVPAVVAGAHAHAWQGRAPPSTSLS
ncbi:hypothetical protein [Oricola thermophila]|uniref:Secreted protein n=1 Tax=Oricola thermophila TaxID=2742145 RepID=A0A6N1V8V3_9HYPH|nr:hypothetical protein [Oricola thermophila]QKV17380.1 hypothetical protein HTY61_02310 [Oricola thermophila]